jgi:ketosteroid isomerase-like protein
MWPAVDGRYSAAVGREQLESIRHSLEAWNRGDIDALLDEVHADSEYMVAEESPNHQVLRGREEIAAYLRDWRQTVSGMHYEILDQRDAGDSVVTLGRMTGRAGDDGPKVTVELAFVSRFDGDRLVRTEEYLDADRALAAAGLA